MCAVLLQVCLGLPHVPSERVQLEDNKMLREQHGFKVWRGWCRALRRVPSNHLPLCSHMLLSPTPSHVQFICAGNSLYESPSKQGSSSGSGRGSGGSGQEGVQTLPYCEGLEVRVRCGRQDVCWRCGV